MAEAQSRQLRLHLEGLKSLIPKSNPLKLHLNSKEKYNLCRYKVCMRAVQLGGQSRIRAEFLPDGASSRQQCEEYAFNCTNM
jgi:hypothetical protein